ncbi:MAG: DUF1080 domain-containing protein [Dinghuibacter sp.]|nr:DUF1080 domain-containing protein [Dinghuibacter sp.]
MKLTLLLLSATGLFICCNNAGKPKTATENNNTTSSATIAEATLTDAEKKDGWELMFDGKTTNGWHKFNTKTIGSAWKVSDGALWLDTSSKKDWQIKDGGDIVSDNEYEHFHLKLEWKIAKNGNSGIMIYAVEDSLYKWPWETAPEMQVLDNSGHPDSKIIKHRAGDLYDLISATPETVKPAGEWNQVEIISNKGNLEFYLNGPKVLQTTLWDDAWKKMVAGSKFKSMPGFGKYKKGRIALQDHGDLVWYRNIKIKRL